MGFEPTAFPLQMGRTAIVLQEQRGSALGGFGFLGQLSLIAGINVILDSIGLIQADALGFARSPKPQAPGCLAIDLHRLQLSSNRATGQDDIRGISNGGDGGCGFSHIIFGVWVRD